MDADEERIPGEGGSSAKGVRRVAGNIGSLSGADDAVYMEYRTRPASNVKHPLFKKFRMR